MVFLGDDLMHSRDYSDDTSRVVDEEVARILHEQEDRARRILSEHAAGLRAVAELLLERETVDGAEVARLIDDAYGEPVHGENPTTQHFASGMLGRPLTLVKNLEVHEAEESPEPLAPTEAAPAVEGEVPTTIDYRPPAAGQTE
jgi:hypothetical protein